MSKTDEHLAITAAVFDALNTLCGGIGVPTPPFEDAIMDDLLQAYEDLRGTP